MYPKTLDRNVKILSDYPLEVRVGPKGEGFACLAKGPALVQREGDKYLLAVSNTLYGSFHHFSEGCLNIGVREVLVDTLSELRVVADNGATYTFRPLTPEAVASLKDSQVIGISSIREANPSSLDQIAALDRIALPVREGWVAEIVELLDNPLD